jgi:hypothetical protein
MRLVVDLRKISFCIAFRYRPSHRYRSNNAVIVVSLTSNNAASGNVLPNNKNIVIERNQKSREPIERCRNFDQM